MKNVLAGKTVLVTGGTGFIGSELVKQALGQGAMKVIIISRNEIKHFLMKKRIQDDRLEAIVGDIRDSRSIEFAFHSFDIDILYHAAAMKHVVVCEDFPLEAAETNIVGTQNVVDLAIKYGVSKMITISTDKAACAVNVMGATKLVAEKITLNANKTSRDNQAFSCVRFGNVANSYGSVIPVYIDNLLNRKPLQVTNPEVTRFIMEVSDAIRLIIKATDYAQGGEIFILKMKAFKLGDLVEVVLDRIAPRLNILREDLRTNVTGLISGEKLHEELINITESSRMYELEDMYAVLPDGESSAKYLAISKADLSRYISSDVEFISKDELEIITLKYLENRPINFITSS